MKTIYALLLNTNNKIYEFIFQNKNVAFLSHDCTWMPARAVFRGSYMHGSREGVAENCGNESLPSPTDLIK